MATTAVQTTATTLPSPQTLQVRMSDKGPRPRPPLQPVPVIFPSPCAGIDPSRQLCLFLLLYSSSGGLVNIKLELTIPVATNNYPSLISHILTACAPTHPSRQFPGPNVLKRFYCFRMFLSIRLAYFFSFSFLCYPRVWLSTEYVFMVARVDTGGTVQSLNPSRPPNTRCKQYLPGR